MLTADRFRALADELAAASPANRAAILARPETAEPVTVAEAAELTGYPVSTLLQYLKPYWRARFGPAAIPPLRADGTWTAGDLALWAAGSQSAGAPVPPRKRGRPRVNHDRYLPVVRAILEAEKDARPPMDVTALRAALAGQGIRVEHATARRLWLAARAIPQPPASAREDGYVTGAQLARAYGVTEGALTHARNRGRLTPVAWEDGHALYDPARVTHPGGTRRTPVDVSGGDSGPQPAP